MILAVAVLSFIRGLQSFNTELLLGTPAGIYVYSTRIYDYHPPRAALPMAKRPRWVRSSSVVLGVLLFFYWRFLQRQAEVHRGHGPRLFDACASSSASGAMSRWRAVFFISRS